ncbi:hypothetical protein Tco_0712804 [Tanacetum coccineum]
MRTRRSNYPNNSNVTIPRRRKRQVSNIVEPEIRTIVAPMAERTMEELLRAPTEGYGEAIVLPEINADHFEIKTNLLQLVQANPFYGHESENPHAHINSFKRITSTLRFRNVPNDVIKLMMFPYSLEGAAKTWNGVKLLQEMDNPAIIYDDALKLESNFSSKPALNSELINSVNLENKTSLPERDYEEYNFISERKALKKRFSKKEKFNILNIDEDLFSYENSSNKNLQLDKGNDNDKIDMALPLRNERHEWLRFDTQGYTEEEQLDFETRLDTLYYRKVHRVQTLDFDGLIEDLDMDMTERLRMQHKNVDGEEIETGGFRAYWADCLRVIASKAALADYWTGIFFSGDFLGSAPSYTLIRVHLRMLCHRLIAFTISDRGQAHEKVTTNDLFYLRSMDEGTVVNVPYLLA